LEEKGLVNYEWREGATLTDEGRTIAVDVLRKNRIIKTFLYRKADYGIHEIFDEACFMEHVVSARFTDALDKMLNFPRVDPHGLPIPSRDGVVGELKGIPLNEVVAPVTLQVIRLKETKNDSVRLFAELGLVPSASFRYKGVDSDGYVFEVDERPLTLSKELGYDLRVEVIHDDQ
jgi:DtxR family Mn-dependent transcriptional regulator